MGASVDCNPAYLTNVINMIGATAKKQTWMKEVVLVVDAMTLNKGNVWDPTSRWYVRHVGYGMAVQEAHDEITTEALVSLVVGMTGHFKHSITYVLQDKCPAIVQAQLIKRLHWFVAWCWSASTSSSFWRKLHQPEYHYTFGCKMKVSHVQPWFQHPHLQNHKV